MPDRESIRQQLDIKPKEISERYLYKISPKNLHALESFHHQLKLKAYSPNTIQLYISEFSQLLSLLQSKPVEDLTPEQLKSYFLYCVEKLKCKERSLNGKINAIKFYFEKVLHRPKMFFDIPRPKTPQSLRKILSRNEIQRVFSQVTNPKHLLMLNLCYGMGLRVSEVVGIKIEHIDSDNMQVLIANAKGKKDRYVHLPESALELLRSYYNTYRPQEWLFEGQYGGQYNSGSVQKVFKRAMKTAKIRKTIGIHGLRHSYATHLLESGTDIRFFQELLGHNNIETTQIYTHISTQSVSNVKSPLDNL